MRSRKRIVYITLGLGVAVLLLAGAGLWGGLRPGSARAADFGARVGPQMGSTHFGLDWTVIGTGGGQTASTHFQINATIGQPATGPHSSAHFANHAGYWQIFSRGGDIFLPVLLRGS